MLDGALLALVVAGVGLVLTVRLIDLTGRRALIVAGGSMAPTIPFGALVVDAPISATELRVGDIVSYRTSAAIVTHRVIGLVQRSGVSWLQLRGDANVVADAFLVPASAVIGQVTVVVPAIGRILGLASEPGGLALLLGLAGALLAAGSLLAEAEPAPRTGLAHARS